MKFAVFLLSVLLLSVALAPIKGLGKDKSEIACCADHCNSDDNNDSSSSDDCDFCNPFLNCSCFAGVVIPQNSDNSITQIAFLQIESKSCYQELSLFQLIIPFWQPPKIKA